MANMLQRGADYLESRRETFAAIAITYARTRASSPADSGLTLPEGVSISAPDSNGNVVVEMITTATVGKNPFEMDTGEGVTVTMANRDYLILISNFSAFWAIAGGDPEPTRGDKIYQGDEIYEVMPLSANIPAFASSGSYGQTWRIHTKGVPS